MAVQIHKVYLLGDFQLEPNNHLLKRQGLPVSLNKKRFQVLVYLIEQRDRLVPRQELLDRFWEGSEVYEENLTKCISEIRKALDDQKKPHRFIETVPARKFPTKFVATACDLRRRGHRHRSECLCYLSLSHSCGDRFCPDSLDCRAAFQESVWGAS